MVAGMPQGGVVAAAQKAKEKSLCFTQKTSINTPEVSRGG